MTAGIGFKFSCGACFSSKPIKKAGARIKRLARDDRFPSVAGSLGGLSRAIAGIVGAQTEVLRKAQIGVAATKFTAAWGLIFDVYGVITSLYNLAVKKDEMSRTDDILSAVGGSGQIADGIANLVEGLVDVGSVSTEAMSWAGPLGLAAASAGLLFTAVNVRSMYLNRKEAKGLKEAHKVSPAKVDEYVSAKKHKYTLSRHGAVKADLFLKKTAKINAQTDGAPKAERLDKAYSALQSRIKKEQWAHGLAILVAVVGFTASVIFFTSTANPAVIAGSVLLGGVFAMCIIRIGLKYHANRQFERKLNKAVTYIPK